MSPQFVLKLKMPAPSRKKGRRSSKKLSNAVRLSCAGSASTWPKSGLIVASSVRLEDRPYLRSTPAVSLFGWSYRASPPLRPGPKSRVSFFTTVYGSSSRRRGDGRRPMPPRVPACDT
jgi:hypothetical protein